ncbi:MAG: uroporphyrinogen decarboxylase [Kiritimatiellae bacterium]|nr:uroporphyrinogen decarboxylase [Kiritimatiellia bacterium]MDW8458628.1 uroporphyrinogen decarboxylase [Verrucomicrobiota bacterium]
MTVADVSSDGASPFLAACHSRPTPFTPIWLMRQAGRYLPEYRAVKEKCGSILNMVKKPEVAAEITMQPLRAFDLDAAIIFADILTLLEPMGIQLEFIKGEGPVLHNPIRSADDVRKLRPAEPAETLSFTMEAIRLVKRELAGRRPLIGFSGAPFTLACYAIEGGSSRDFMRTRTFMYNEPEAWSDLMGRLASDVGDYLAAQIEAGVDAVQMFDSWAGILSPADYERYVLPYSRVALERALRRRRVPRIHFGTGTGGFLHLMQEAGCEVVGMDWRVDLASAWASLGRPAAVQGNLDPIVLFAPPEEIRRQAARILLSVRGRPGHIFNLGHGVLEHTPVDNVRLLVDFVHEYSMHLNESAPLQP